MKKYHLLLSVGMLLIVQATQAQITLNLALNSRPEPWLSDWSNPVNGQMIITYMTGPALNDPNIKIKTTILGERGNIIGASNINSARTYTLRPGVNQFSMAEALQFQNLVLPGNVQNLLQRTGRLAAGQYQLKVDLMNSSGDIVRASQTRPFFIVSHQLPVLIQPANDAMLDAAIAQNTIIFRWTSLSPGGAEVSEYRVQVFEILPLQTAMQAFRGNRPLLDEPVRGATQYIWHPRLAMLDSTANSKFIWTVQTLDRRGLPIQGTDMNVQGRSEPATFSIVNQMRTIDKTRKKDELIKP